VEAAIPALARLLDAADPNARVAAIEALDRLGPPDDVKARLVEIARTDEDWVRAWAMPALGSYRDRDLTALLVSLLADPSWRISSSAALALGKQADPAALEPLRNAQRRCVAHRDTSTSTAASMPTRSGRFATSRETASRQGLQTFATGDIPERWPRRRSHTRQLPDES
jgi:HEAT repeats